MAAASRDAGLQRMVENFAGLLQPINGGSSFYEDHSKGFDTLLDDHSFDRVAWMSNVVDDETIEPASDGPSLCNGSDGYISSSSSSPAEQLRGSADQRHILHRPATGINFQASPSPVYQAAHTVDPRLPDELVDIDAGEGRRRGDLLFAMLCGPASPASEPLRPVPSFQCSASAAAAPVQHGHDRLQRPWMQPAAPVQSSSSVHVESGASRSASVHQAAHHTFGHSLAEISVNPASNSDTTGYVIRLNKPAAAESCGLPRAMLDNFTNSLRRSLGRDVVSFEQRASGAHSGSSSSMRFTLRSNGENACWDFARRGVCPRGSSCTWVHSAETLHIEVFC